MSITDETRPPDTTADTGGKDTAPLALRLTLAALCAAAGAVHLVMVPGHSQESTLDGVMFLLGGWAQIALAVGLVAWPHRAVLQAAVVVNLAAVVTWVVSRTAGLPFVADPGQKEAAATLDQMTTAFEVLAVLLAVALLALPGLWASFGDRALVVGAILPAATLVATSVILTSPEAANHHASDPAAPSARRRTGPGRASTGVVVRRWPWFRRSRPSRHAPPLRDGMTTGRGDVLSTRWTRTSLAGSLGAVVHLVWTKTGLE